MIEEVGEVGSHVVHSELRRYDANAVLHDGCPECERRGHAPRDALCNMDPEKFARCWRRMIAWQKDELVIQHCEAAPMEALYLMAVLMERHLCIPFGTEINDVWRLRWVYAPETVMCG